MGFLLSHFLFLNFLYVNWNDRFQFVDIYMYKHTHTYTHTPMAENGDISNQVVNLVHFL